MPKVAMTPKENPLGVAPVRGLIQKPLYDRIWVGD